MTTRPAPSSVAIVQPTPALAHLSEGFSTNHCRDYFARARNQSFSALPSCVHPMTRLWPSASLE